MMRLASLLIALAAAAPAADACTIPVFRFALDRWAPDSYRLEVAPADAASPEISRFLRNFGANSPLNLEVKRQPVASPAPSRLFAPQGDTPVWEGTLDGSTLSLLTESPHGAELARRILTGETAVWVLAESGDPDADAQTAARVEKRLRYLEEVAQLPVIDPNDPSSQLGPGPALAVRFSLMRVPRNEAVFRRLLAGPDSALPDSGAPWLAVVYGRGRVLGAWPAAEAGDAQIEQGCLFLLGACSCQVKNLNPGWDLLLPVDWDAQLQALGQSPLPVAPQPAASPAPVTVTISGGSPSPRPRGHDHGAWIGILVISLAAVTLWQLRNRRR